MTRKYLHTDEDLLRGLKAGDTSALDNTYDKYWETLLAISYKFVKDKVYAEEIVQEVFISLWRRREQLEIDNLPSYLATAVKFSTFRFLQSAKRRKEVEEAVYISESVKADDKIEAKFLKEYVDGVVEELPRKCRVVFRLSRDEQMSNQEISEELAITKKAVEWHITNALKAIRKELNKLKMLFL